MQFWAGLDIYAAELVSEAQWVASYFFGSRIASFAS